MHTRRAQILSLFVIFFCTYCWPQQFKAASSLPVISLDGGALIDLNKDGKPDLLSLGQDGHFGTVVTVTLGNGDGTFGTPITSNLGILGPSPSLALFAAVADVNGDGNPDLIVQNVSTTHLIFVSLGNGDGTFQPPFSLSTVHDYSSFIAADLDGDGKVDLAAVNFNDFPAVLSIFKGNGDGTFLAPVNTTLFGEPTALVLGDFNNDGQPDLAVPDTSQHLTVFLNAGNGTFTTKGPFATGSGSNTAPFPMSIATADLNGDGKLDIVLTDSLDGKVSVLLGNGDGTFGNFTQLPAGTGVASLAIADLNEDGIPDLVVQNQDASDLGILIGNGNGTFQPMAEYVLSGYITIGPLFVADFNQDGHLDVASLQGIAFGAGDGTFPLTAKAVTVPAQPSAIATGDFNGDGIPDFVITDVLTPSMSLGLGKGDGTFSLSTITANVGGAGLAVADVNKDGKQDIVLASTSSNSVSVFLGNGDGTFQPQTDFAVDPNPNNISVADVNHDGNLDLLVTHGTFANHGSPSSPSRIAVLLGNGDGTFQPPQFFIPSGGAELPLALAVADFNGDTNLDFVVGDRLAGAQTPFLGNGAGGFSQFPFFNDDATSWIVAGDFNGDGKPDLIVSHGVCAASPTNGSCIRALLNNGSGIAFTAKDSPVPFFPDFLASADFDGDGKLDVASSFALNNVVLLKGNGDGSFQQVASYVSGQGTLPLAIADVNGDGSPDILAASGLFPAVYTLLNSTAAPVTLPPGFAFSSPFTTATVKAGQSATLTTSVAGLGGFASQISFSCTGLPALSSCSFSPATLTPSSVAAPVTVTITTTGTGTGSGQVASLSSAERGKHLALAGLVLAGLVAMAFAMPDGARNRGSQLLGLCLIAAVLSLSACGGGGGSSSPAPTPIPTPTPTPTPTPQAATLPGRYHVQVRATATTGGGKTVVHIVPVTVIVQ